MRAGRNRSGGNADTGFMVDLHPQGDGACAHPDCSAPGQYRAPKSREEQAGYYWFCLEHVREYNAAWNYYAGMDDDAVERLVREDSVWRRPTWPLGARGAEARLRDPLGVFGDVVDPSRAREGDAQMQAMTASERAALSELGLTPPVTLADVKLRYKVLAKTLHPDANGGDKVAEERLKSVNHAYKTLKDSDRLR